MEQTIVTGIALIKIFCFDEIFMHLMLKVYFFNRERLQKIASHRKDFSTFVFWILIYVGT